MSTTTIQTGHSNNILSVSATTNYADQSTINTCYDSTSPGYLYYGLYTFDVSALIGSTVSSASFSVYCTNAYGATGRQHIVNQIIRNDWSYSQSNYNIYKTGSNWGTAGASNTTSDITTSGEATANAVAAGNWMTFDITSIVKDAIANRSGIVNIRLKNNVNATSNDYVTAGFGYATENLRPKLDITYTISTNNGASFLLQMI